LDYNQYDKSNPILNRYIHTNKSDVEDHVSGMPCEEIWDWYKQRRFDAALALKQKKEEAQEDECRPMSKKGKKINPGVPLCPVCGKQTNYHRKKTNDYVCKCGHIFEQTELNKALN
jgi:lysyl-tRNA synthetase class I